jgi:NADPH-dependent 2,4-dienoyl-CoA reductase/sulfur reductase-like enzyme
VLVVGGGRIGCEVAEFLAERYKEVMILDMLGEIGSDIGPSLRPRVLKRIKESGIQIETGVKIMQITEKGVRGLRNGSSEFFNAGTVVVAAGMKRQLAEDLQGMTEVHLIGDCKEPRNMREAIAEGYVVGLKI